MEKFPDLDNFRYIHFIGIGGVSMSSLAMILKKQGKNISGSDSTKSYNTEMLKSAGIKVYIGHDAKNVGSAQLVVYTAAISDKNPELVYAKQNGIPIIERAVLLGMLMSTFNHSIAVAGTHGKSTTTSMISSILLSADRDPTILIGAHFKLIGGNYKVGNSAFSVYEACEYVNSFLHFYPETAVILNIDADHLDFFKDINSIKASFLKFTENVREDGVVIINGDDENCKSIIKNCKRKTITFGLSKSNYCHACNIRYDAGKSTFDVIYGDEIIHDVKLSVLGDHNIYNALASICSAKGLYEIDNESIRKGIFAFTGADRRFEIIKYYNGAAIVDDYGHHPSEIHATISAAKSANFKKITVIFQPHTYTRTKFFLDEFASALSEADSVIITDIYSAREINTVGVNIIDLKNRIDNSIYISDFNDIAEFIKSNAKEGEVYILQGAGNINAVGDLI